MSNLQFLNFFLKSRFFSDFKTISKFFYLRCACSLIAKLKGEKCLQFRLLPNLYIQDKSISKYVPYEAIGKINGQPADSLSTEPRVE